MKRQIIVTIEPDDDGVRCGRCRGQGLAGSSHPQWSGAWCDWQDWASSGKYLRGPRCLVAEKLMADLRKAGEKMRGYFVDAESVAGGAWNRALAAIDAQAKP